MPRTLNLPLPLSKRLSKQDGFTLIELIIVIAIIGVLVAIAIPVYGSIQANARTEGLDEATENMHLGAMIAYTDENSATDPEELVNRVSADSEDLNFEYSEGTRAGGEVGPCVVGTWVDDVSNVGPVAYGACS